MRPIIWTLGSSLIFCFACSPSDPSGRGDLPAKLGNSPDESSLGGPARTPGGNGGGNEQVPGILVDEPEPEKPPPAGCGNGELTEDEACDDGNKDSGDGCAANCLQLEPGFSCAAPGKPCIPLARCGDGVVAVSEQCDDMNLIPGDGCSERCRVELGSKCEGAPSTCTPTTCGDGLKEGAEACDDGNTQPFDGCSSVCLREPNCAGLSCTSECGDGLVIDEECDDGNQVSGDGCSAECKKENGFTCERAAVCEQINGECALRVPAIFRDFTDAHPDFGGHSCSALAQGAVEQDLNAAGKPVMRAAAPKADPCLSTAENFSQWYTDAGAAPHVGQLVLFDNGRGGYVNRFDNEGKFFTATAEEENYPGGKTLAECQASCQGFVSNKAQCQNTCLPQTQAAQQAPQRAEDAQRRLEDAIRQHGAGTVVGGAAGVGDAGAPVVVVPPQVAAAQATYDAAAAAVLTTAAAATTCQTECAAKVAAATAECSATCRTCNTGTGFCTFGQLVEYEGNPLFFPVDKLSGNLGMCSAAKNKECAKVPEQYGYNGWPWEYQIFANAPEHNFYFTSEVQYWFQYDPGLVATLDFTGDDDVWVFINGKLAVDIGGIHVPVNGSVTIDQSKGTLTTTVSEPVLARVGVKPTTKVTNASFTASEFGLEEGHVYKINVFHAERQKEGSSFKLTLSGFEAAPSECSAICGDGVLSFGEECDDGINDGGYGECDAGCKLGPFCGDGIVQGDEHCDNGPGGGEGCPNCRKIKVMVAK